MPETLRSVLELSLRVARRVARLALAGAKRGASILVEKVRERRRADVPGAPGVQPPQPPVPERQSVAAAPPPPPPPVEFVDPGQPPADITPGPVEAASSQAEDSQEAILVAEVADPGAERGAGPEIRVAEPWEGYSGMKASEVIARLAEATPEEAAIVQLFERMHRGRKTVLAAAEKRL